MLSLQKTIGVAGPFQKTQHKQKNQMKKETTQIETSFVFGDHPCRVINHEGQPWFVARDVCEILGVENSRDSISSLEDYEKGVGISDTLGGRQSVAIVNESGLYRLIFRSRKPAAKQFQRWVFEEVLPSIRRNGCYSPAHIAYLALIREQVALGVDPNVAAKAAVRLAGASGTPKHGGWQAAIQGVPAMADDAQLIFSAMTPEIPYRMADIIALVPPGHALLAGTKRAAESRIGSILTKLHYSGSLNKIKGRNACYVKPQPKVIQMTAY